MQRDKIFIEVGKAVSLIQLCDHSLKSTLFLVFPGRKFNDQTTFQKNILSLEKATLGRMISVLKKRVRLINNFDVFLSEYLEERNLLIHNWSGIQHWDDESMAIDFTVSLQKKAVYLTYVFLSFLRSWMDQVNFPKKDAQFPELAEIFTTIDSDWRHLSNEFIEDINNSQ